MNAATKQKEVFIGTTMGLKAFINNRAYLVRVEFWELSDGNIKLKAVSGHNLASLRRSCVISRRAFDNRPSNDAQECIWAQELCGFESPWADQ